DVRMIKGSQHLGFAAEACHTVGVLRPRFGKDFDGYVTVEFGVRRAPDFAHAALAEFGRDAIMRDRAIRTHGYAISGMVSLSSVYEVPSGYRASRKLSRSSAQF